MTVVHKKVDFVTIGAGYTAGIFAWALAKSGHHVVSIEQGYSRWAYPDFAHDHDGLQNSVRKAMMIPLNQTTWTWRPNPQAPSLPLRKYGSFHPGQGYGGAGAHWSGMLWRYLPSDFQYRTHYTQRYGANKLPEGNTIQDWPVTYDEMEPYYDRFEYDQGASGQAGNLNGQIIEGGNPFEGPRRRPFPLPPLATTRAADLFAEGAQKLGYKPFPQPSGILSRGYTDVSGRSRSACIYCGFCTRFGCEVDAKGSAVATYLPAALNTGRYEIRPNSHVTQINTAPGGMATGLTYIDANGTEHFQPAEVVLVTGYTLANVHLLLLSRDGNHPNGVGNDRNRVGKNMTYQHWHTTVQGVFPGQRFNLYMGNTSTLRVIYEFNGDNFDHSNVDFVGGASIFCGDGEQQPIDNALTVPLSAISGSSGGGSPSSGGAQKSSNSTGQDPPHRADTWGPKWKDFLRNYWDSVARMTMQGESLPYEDQFYDLDPTYKDAWGRPLLRITFDWHPNDYEMYQFITEKSKEIMRAMGTDKMESVDTLSPYNIQTYQSTHMTGGAIMGSDPGNSVCNKYGQVWDTPNVFVTGAALWPQNPGANPTGTVCAHAYLGVDGLKNIYLKNTGKIIA